MNRKYCLVLLSGVLFSSSAKAGAPTLTIQLSTAEDNAFHNSPKYQAMEAEARSADLRSSGQFAQLFPRLTMEGSYRHVSEVPQFFPVPGVPAVPFGDNLNYSYGPALYWTVFNSGGLYNKWKAQDASARSKMREVDVVQRQLLLETRVGYFQVQLSLEQVRLLVDSLRLALEQYRDIDIKYRAGTLSHIDSLSAHQEVLKRQRDLKQAQADLAGALRNLFALTGLGKDVNPTYPMAQESASLPFLQQEEVTLLVSLDPVPSSTQRLLPAAQGRPDVSHPALQVLADSAESARRTAASIRSGHGPTVQLMAKASRDYPNGPVLESFNQETLSLTANWPIFEAGRVLDEAQAQVELALSADKRKEQVGTDLRRDWDKAHDQLQSLLRQQDINRQSVKETEELAKLVYDSYKAGRSSYLEVDNANFNALQAKVVSVRIDVQILIQLAILDSLGTKG